MTGALRDSGVGWLGAAPEDWPVVPARALFGERKQKSNSADVHLTPSQKYGVLPQVEYMAITGSKVVLNLSGADNMRHVEAGDYVSHLRSFQGGLEFAGMPGKVSAAYTVLKPKVPLEPRFFKYLFKSDLYIQALQTTTDQLRDGQSIRYGQFTLIPLPYPALEEQRAIADYLDRETAQIDRFIAKNEELIALLTERRAAAISYCALKGLRADSELAATGQGWLGDIPAHWQVVPWKAVFRERRTRAYPEDVHLTPSQRHGVLPQTDYMRLTGTRVVLNLTAPSDMKHVEPHDLVSHLRSFQGGLELSTVSGKVSMAYSVFRPLGDLLPVYYRYLLKCSRFVEALQTTTDQLRDGQSIRAKELSILRYPVPPAAEQIEIAEHLDEMTGRIDSAVETAQRSITLASERRAALISAAVTGKIDVGVAG